MAKITSYPFDNRINGSDTLLGTDTSTRQTSQFSISSIQSFIIENGDVITGTGTKDTIPIFTDFQGTVGDSIITYNSAGNFISVGASLTTNLGDGFVSSPVYTGTDLFITNISASGGGSVSLIGNVTIGDQATDILQITSKVSDSTGTSSAAAGEVLVSNAAGQLVWAGAPGGGLGGSGTINTIPLFTGATTLGDSIVTQSALGQGITVGGDLQVTAQASFDDVVLFSDEVEFSAEIADGAGSTGTAGQLLSSTGAGGIQWVDNASASTDLKQVDVTLTDTQMLSLNGGSTLELIPAPGVGRLLAVLNVILYLDYNTTTYNFTATGISDNVSFYIGSDQSRGINSGILNSTADKYVSFDFPNADVNTDIQPNVSFSIQSSSGITVSTGDSPFKFSILYREVVLP